VNPSYTFQWSLIADHWNVLLWGAWLDVWASAIGFAFACAVGMAAALLRLSGSRAAAAVAVAFTEVARGIPPYVLLLWVHYGLPGLLGIVFTPMQSIVIVLTVQGGGYAAEVFRAGIAAIDRGQAEAARSLGLGTIRVYADVILPQALRIVVPPLGNVLIGVLKSATLMGVIALPDLLHAAQGINVNFFAPFEAFTAVLLIFVSLVFAVSVLVLAIERAMAHP